MMAPRGGHFRRHPLIHCFADCRAISTQVFGCLSHKKKHFWKLLYIPGTAENESLNAARLMPTLLPLLSAEVCRAQFCTSSTNRSTGSQHATCNVSSRNTFIARIDRYCHGGFHGVQRGIPPKLYSTPFTRWPRPYFRLYNIFFISNISTDEPGALPSLTRVNKRTLAFENVTPPNS